MGADTKRSQLASENESFVHCAGRILSTPCPLGHRTHQSYRTSTILQWVFSVASAEGMEINADNSRHTWTGKNTSSRKPKHGVCSFSLPAPFASEALAQGHVAVHVCAEVCHASRRDWDERHGDERGETDSAQRVQRGDGPLAAHVGASEVDAERE
eukprot:6179409-Pleurochrysis_carterae.AAC.1